MFLAVKKNSSIIHCTCSKVTDEKHRQSVCSSVCYFSVTIPLFFNNCIPFRSRSRPVFFFTAPAPAPAPGKPFRRHRLRLRLRPKCVGSGGSGSGSGSGSASLVSIVIEIIAIFCENSPILRKFDLFDPCDLKLDLIKNDLSILVELATAYPTPFTACRYLS